MIKKSPKKYFILLAILELFLIAGAFNQYLMHRGDTEETDFAASSLLSRAGELRENGYYVDDRTKYAGTFTYGPYVSLKRGSYEMTVRFSTDTDGSTCHVHSGSLTAQELQGAEQVKLYKGESSVTFPFEVYRAAQDIELVTEFGGDGYLEIQGITIRETPQFYSRQIVCVIFFCLLLTFCYLFYVSDVQTRKTALVLSLITMAASLPIFSDYMLPGHDLRFHLMRIEGIKEGLENGVFPVKIQSLWAEGHGYAVGVFYGDAFLYFPALLRLLGFSIQDSYNVYLFAVNALTALISWKCFKKIFDSNFAGLLGSMLYTLSAYRLANVYLRAAVGEYTALAFFPLVLCGFYLIFTQSPKEKGYMKNFLMPALGLTGIIQTHVISCELVGAFIIIACLIMIGRVIIPKVFATLCLALGATVLLNAGFLVPFLSYFGGDYVINSPQWYQRPIQEAGAYTAQLFALFQNGVGSSVSTEFGMAGEMPLGTGFPLMFGLGVFLFILALGPKPGAEDKNRRFLLLSGAFGVCGLFMSTSLFPGNGIASLGGIFRKLIYNIQFPWRLLTIATVFLTVVSCFAFLYLKNKPDKNIFYSAFTLLLCTLLISAGWFYYDCLNQNRAYRLHDPSEFDTKFVGSEEYLPSGTDLSLIERGASPVLSPGTSVSGYSKKGTSVRLTAETGSGGGYIELPLFLYPGYQAVSLEDGAALAVEKGANNVVKVLLPANFRGGLSVSFREPLSWRLGELFTLISALALAAYGCALFSGYLKRRKTAVAGADGPEQAKPA